MSSKKISELNTAVLPIDALDVIAIVDTSATETKKIGFLEAIRSGVSVSADGLEYNSATGVFSSAAGYSIPTDTSQANWNTAYGWGNHAGLYDSLGAGQAVMDTHELAFDHTLIATALQAETDPLSVHIDQTTPQTITGGIPLLTGLTPTTDYQIATKKYVDDAVLVEDLWNRAGTVISPKTAGDSITTTGVGTFGSLSSDSGAVVSNGSGTLTVGYLKVAFNIKGLYGGSTSIDPYYGYLFDSASVVSVDWEVRQLYASDGTTVILDWATAGTAGFGANDITTTGTGTFGSLSDSGTTTLGTAVTGTGAGVTLFPNVATGDRPIFRLYGYRDYTGVAPVGKNYIDLYIDYYGRGTFGGGGAGFLGWMFMNQLTLGGSNAEYINFPGNGRYNFGYSSTYNTNKFVNLNMGLSATEGRVLALTSTRGFNYAVPLETDPTLMIFSDNYNTNQYLFLQHNGTTGIIKSGTGEISFDDNSLTTTGTGTFGSTNQVILGGASYAINAVGDSLFTGTITGTSSIKGTSFIFEKGTYDLTLASEAIATSAKTITFPNLTGTVALMGVTQATNFTTTGTLVGRHIASTAASDPQHATAGSRPAGVVGEIVYYTGKLYFCTNAVTPLWELITSS